MTPVQVFFFFFFFFFLGGGGWGEGGTGIILCIDSNLEFVNVCISS